MCSDNPLGFSARGVHRDLLWVILDRPDAARADTGADAAADAAVRVARVLDRAVLVLDAVDGLLRAGFEAHLAVAAGAAAHAALVVADRVAELAVVALLEVCLREALCRDLLLLGECLDRKSVV